MTPTPEFSRPLPLDGLKADARERVGEASPEECRALAERLAIPAVKSLSYRMTLYPYDKGKGVSVHGEIEAEVTQTCVVTLEPFDSALTESFSVELHRDADKMADEALQGVEDPDSELLDSLPEPLEAESVDLGEIATQQLALALPDHPKAPGAALEMPENSAEEGDFKPESPFAALANLKKPEE